MGREGDIEEARQQIAGVINRLDGLLHGHGEEVPGELSAVQLAVALNAAADLHRAVATLVLRRAERRAVR